jgi:TorA-specific chaperone
VSIRGCAALGMSVAADTQEPADHLPIQLAVLAELLRRGDAALAHRFCEQQLRPWLPMFLDQCRARDPSGFYAGAAMVVDRVAADHVSAPRADAA